MNDTDQSNTVTVSVQYGDLDTVIHWCTENCIEGWDLAEIKEFGGMANGIYQFNFESAKDATYFNLKWT